MRKSRSFLTAVVSALAAAALVGAAPSLFARGDSGGGGGGGQSGGGARGTGGGGTDLPDPSAGTGSVGSLQSGSNTNSTKHPDERRDLPEFARDGEEQKQIRRDALDRMSRARWRDLREARNRAAAEPSRDGDRR